MKMTLKQLIEKANEQLMEIDNQLVKTGDSRMKNTVSERRVRSYINNKVLHKPFRADGEIWYDESHLERLIAIRSLQGTGMSESAIKAMSSIYQSDEYVGDGNLPVNAYTEPQFLSLNEPSGLSISSEENDDDSKKSALNGFLKGLSANNNSVVAQSANASSRMVGACADPLANTFLNSVPLVSSSRNIYETGSKDDTEKRKDLSYALNAVSRSPVKTVQEYQLDELGKVFLRVEDGAKISNPAVVLEKIKQILNIKEN